MRRQLKARLLALSPRAFEVFAGDLLGFVGLHDIVLTRYSGDGGIDATGTLLMGDSLIRIPTGVQVKRLRANVGRPEIDRFLGALSNRLPHGIFITTAGYAPQAALRAASAIPPITTLGGEQVVALMLRHRIGVAEGVARGLDEAYFADLEALAGPLPGRVAERGVAYEVGEAARERAARPEEDLISLRALSHALRVDTGVLRRRIEAGQLVPDRPAELTAGRLFFRRDRVEAIRAALLGDTRPASPDEWRQEFLAFARSKTMTRSYKPVLLKALLTLVDRDGAARLDALVAEFRAFYRARRAAGLPVEFGPPDPSDSATLSDAELRQLIVRHPLERFLIKGYLEYLADAGLVRFAPQLWAELRAWELLDLQRAADEQLDHYYRRRR
jgi:hypothetical protein